MHRASFAYTMCAVCVVVLLGKAVARLSNDNRFAQPPVSYRSPMRSAHTDTNVSENNDVPLFGPGNPALPLPQAATYLGIGRSRLFLLLKDGRLAYLRQGGRRYIRRDVLDSYLAALPIVQGPQA
jgi:excisionase family DNA binding protein